MSFNSDFSKARGDHFGSSPPAGISMNLKPSVGLFRNGGEQGMYMKGNVQCPAHNASYSMAPQSNYGMLKDQQSMKSSSELRATSFGQSSLAYNTSSPQMNSFTPGTSK